MKRRCRIRGCRPRTTRCRRAYAFGTALRCGCWIAVVRCCSTRTDDEGMARYPVWSPTGNRIAFASVRIASVRLSAKPSEGTGDEEVLLESSQDALLTDWSQDGRFLLYFAPDPKTGTDLWMLPRDTRVPKVFLATAANEMWGEFSPDGRWVAYQSNETGRFEIYVRSFPAGGVAIPISTAGGVYARWSRDGNELYYAAPDATMMAVPIRRTATTLSADSPVALFKTRRVGGGVNVIGYGHQYRRRAGRPLPDRRGARIEPAADHARDELETVEPLTDCDRSAPRERPVRDSNGFHGDKPRVERSCSGVSAYD